MRGIYSFVLVFAFTASLLLVISTTGIAREKLSEGELVAARIEKISFQRFQLEENTDAIIEESIQTGILTGNRDGETLNIFISSSIEKFYSKQKEIEFFEVNTRDLTTHFTPRKKELTPLVSLEQNCKTIVLNIKEQVYLVQFEFTGGLMRDKAVLGRIREGNAEQYFLILPGYSIEKVVVT